MNIYHNHSPGVCYDSERVLIITGRDIIAVATDQRMKGRRQSSVANSNQIGREPQYGEVNLPFLFNLLDEIGYTGWVGCEYRPKASTAAGLTWALPYGPGPG